MIYKEDNVHYRRGMELFQHNKFGSAEEEFNQAIIEIKNNGETNDHLFLINAYYYQALCSKNLARPDAEKLFFDLVDHFEKSPVTRLSYFHLGDIYFEKKKYDKAIASYKQADKDDLNPVQKTEYAFQLGFSYFYKKDFDKAQPLFGEVMNLEGKYYYPANYYYGYISYKKGDYAQALKSFKVVEKSSLYEPIVPYYIANIKYHQKKYDEVIEYASALADKKVQYTLEMQQLIGKSYFQKKQYDKALPYLTAYMSGTNKINKSDLYQIAYCQYEVKNYNEAINSFKELNVVKDSLGQNSMYLLANSYLKTNQKNEARLAFEEASKLPFDPFVKEQATFQFAKLSYDLNYHDVTVKSLQNFISEYPNSKYTDEAKEYLSLELLATQDFKDALEVLRSITDKNLQIRKAYQKVSYSYATELYNLKEYENAL
ncbi:MAG: tetratricopeptide repeat protein, partial [Chitinophagales bacterium]|nr:tetratricopeptide repeat protein [Chitinophagales bacterium]